MLQLFAASIFSLLALGALGFIAGMLAANRDAIVGALANRGVEPDPGFIWVARVRRVSRPSPSLARNRPQPLREVA
ncbi:MAG: hypothetical protein JOY99_02250 [Sphingomonadaceae bacterium]|nr:hypothetical protein [Sphingomonadaceae bacterium]